MWFLVLPAIAGVACADIRRLQVAHCGRICSQQSKKILKLNLPQLQRNIFNGLVRDRKVDTRTWIPNPLQARATACVRKCLYSRSPALKAHSKVTRLRRGARNHPQSKITRLRRTARNHPDCPGVGPSPGVVQNISVYLERSAPGASTNADWTIIVRWSPLQISSNRNGSVVDWTGYSVAWFTPDLMIPEDSTIIPCKRVPKNQTTTRITEKDGWIYPHGIQIAVTTFPTATRDIDFQGYPFSGEATTPFGTKKATSQATTPIRPTTTKATSQGNYLTPGHIVAICTGLIGGGILVTSLLVYVRHKASKSSWAAQTLSEAEVFVSYSRANHTWVHENLLTLMDHNSISYLIDYKDFEPGQPWIETLVDCIRRSHNVLIIMSREYMSRSNCLAELEQAMYWARDGKTLIVIRINDISKEALPCPIRNRTFIDYADRIERQTWKRRLIRVLKASKSASELPLANVSCHCSGREKTVETSVNV